MSPTSSRGQWVKEYTFLLADDDDDDDEDQEDYIIPESNMRPEIPEVNIRLDLLCRE